MYRLHDPKTPPANMAHSSVELVMYPPTQNNYLTTSKSLIFQDPGDIHRPKPVQGRDIIDQ